MDAQIKQDINKDYYSCIGEYTNLKAIMNDILNIKFLNTDSAEEIELKQARINGASISLGRIGELAYKYLLKLKQIELFPKQNYDQFSDSERIYKKGKLADLVNKKVISQQDADEINAFVDNNNQKFHNFMFLELVTKKVMPSVYSDFEWMMEYEFYSKIIDQMIEDNSKDLELDISYMDADELSADYFLRITIFPRLLEDYENKEADEIYYTAIKKVKDTIKTAKSNGDIFTRLRYYSNRHNNDNVTIAELNDIYEYISVLVSFISCIHKNNKLMVPVDVEHARKEAIKHNKLIGRSVDSINYIFDSYKDSYYINLFEILFSGYVMNEEKDEIKVLKELLKKYNIEYNEYGLSRIISSKIRPYILEDFYQNGVYDLSAIENMLYGDDEYGHYMRTREEVKKLIEGYKSNKLI